MRWRAGEQVEFVPLAGCNHFTILEDLARTDGVQMEALVEGWGDGSRPCPVVQCIGTGTVLSFRFAQRTVAASIVEAEV